MTGQSVINNLLRNFYSFAKWSTTVTGVRVRSNLTILKRTLISHIFTLEMEKENVYYAQIINYLKYKFIETI